VFEQFYTERNLAFEDTAFDGRSDYEAFALAGIPAGGLFSGAEGIKTPEQAARYGGTAGAAYDPDYHQVGDRFNNVSLEVLDQNADAIAFSTLTFAYSTELVSGAPGSLDVSTVRIGELLLPTPHERLFVRPVARRAVRCGAGDHARFRHAYPR